MFTWCCIFVSSHSYLGLQLIMMHICQQEKDSSFAVLNINGKIQVYNTKHRMSTSIPHPPLSWTILSSCFRSLFILLISISNSRHHVFLVHLLLLFSLKFQVWACFMMQFDDSRNVCPIHLQQTFRISTSIGLGYWKHNPVRS